jgi:hypothetical protein
MANLIKEFSIGNEVNILRQMGSCSNKFMQHAFGVIKVVKILVSKDKEESEEVLLLIAPKNAHISSFDALLWCT